MNTDKAKRLARRSLRLMVFWVVMSSFCPARAQRLIGQDPGWETLEPCRLLAGWGNDGDSFHVEHEGREYVFRLYSVDTPECGDSYPDRVKRQAAYFGITETASVELGKEAAKTTEDYLRNGFRVVTRWQNARGNGDLPRFYAAVFVETNDLARVLVKEGYACRMGARADYPGGMAPDEYSHLLHDVEVEAKLARHGAWSDRWPVNPENEIAAAPPEGEVPVVDLNTAKPAELKLIPGMSLELMKRIVKNRPYQHVDELLRISSIRPATLERLRPYLKADAPAVQP